MVTPAELLKETAGRSEITNGMLNRFLLYSVRKYGSLPFGGNWDDEAASFAVPFQAALEQARNLGEIGWSDEAADLWRVEYAKWSAPRGGDVGSVTARAADQILRLALLYAVADGSNHILLPHLQAALALYAHCDQTAVDLFSPRPGATPGPPDEVPDSHSQGEPFHVHLLALIRAQPGIRRSDLSRRFSHTQTADLHAALGLLQRHGLAYCKLLPTAGRQAECWYPAGGDGDDEAEAADGEAAACPTGGGGVDDDQADAAGLLPAAEEEVETLTADSPTGGGGVDNLVETADRPAAEEEVARQPA